MPPKSARAMQNPLGIEWPHHIRAGLAPPHYFTRERKFEFMAQLYTNRLQHLQTLDNLTEDDKIEETARQRNNLNSKQMKLNRRRKLIPKEERKRRRAQAAAEAEAQLPPIPPTPPGTRPPSPVAPDPHTPVEHPLLDEEDIAAGQVELQLRIEHQNDLQNDNTFDDSPAIGTIPGIPNTKDPAKSDLTILNNEHDTFNIWYAIAISLYGTIERWPSVKASIIKYFFHVMNDPSHPRHRVYHVLQKISELYTGKPDLAGFILNHDRNKDAWSMDPGLWTIIADFYDVEVVVIRHREVFPASTVFPEIYNDEDPMRPCDHFVVVRGDPNSSNNNNQIILYFIANPDDTEQAFPVYYPPYYDHHMRDPHGQRRDFSNRVDDMPWCSKWDEDLEKQVLRYLGKLVPAPKDVEGAVASGEEELQLAVLGRELAYIEVDALGWLGELGREEGHMDTWGGEVGGQQQGP